MQENVQQEKTGETLHSGRVKCKRNKTNIERQSSKTKISTETQ